MTATKSNSRRAGTRSFQKSRFPFMLIVGLLFLYALPSFLNTGWRPFIPGDRSSADIIPLPPGPDVTIIGPATLARLGGAGSPDNLSDFNHAQPIAVGDFNGDGIDDLAVAAPDAQIIVGSTLRSDAGVVYLIFGRSNLPVTLDTASGPSGGVSLTILGAADGDHFGFALAAGEVNGDGITDLLVGAPGASSSSHPAAGAVYLFTGSKSLGALSSIDLAQGAAADAVIYGAGERFGCALATGDAGGPTGTDGIADLLVGAPGSSPASSGSAYLIYGRTSFGTSIRVLDVASGEADFTVQGSSRFRLGAAVALGDFNGDGLADLFAGAPGADRPFRIDANGSAIISAGSVGAVFGLLGPFAQGKRANIENNSQALSFYGASPGDGFGTAVAAGDLTGDGLADLAVGAPEAAGNWKDPSTGTIYVGGGHGGAVYVFVGGRGAGPGRRDILAGELLTTSVGGLYAWTGYALAIGSYNVAGNVDRIADLLFASPGGVRQTGRELGGRGSVHMLFGGETLGSVTTRPRSPFNPAPRPEETFLIEAAFEYNADFGFAVATGDLNGDGAGDAIVCGPFAEASGRRQAGAVWIWYGTPRPGGDPGPQPVTVHLSSPAEREQLIAGKPMSVNWSVSAVEQVKNFELRMSTDGGASFPTLIASGLAANQTSYVWTVPELCASHAHLQIAATTIAGQEVVDSSGNDFVISQAGTDLDLTRSTIAGGALSLVAASGQAFATDTLVEISSDEDGASFAAFSRPAKIKSAGKKMVTRGMIGGQEVESYFPDGAVRVLRLMASPCRLARVKVRRAGVQLLLVNMQ
jgi:FG-GAP repeat